MLSERRVGLTGRYAVSGRTVVESGGCVPGLLTQYPLHPKIPCVCRA